MTPKPKFVGCGAPAQRIIYRGPVKRTFACAACASNYAGSGKVHPYATDTLGKAAPDGHHTGPAKNCGDVVGEDA